MYYDSGFIGFNPAQTECGVTPPGEPGFTRIRLHHIYHLLFITTDTPDRWWDEACDGGSLSPGAQHNVYSNTCYVL